MLGDLWRFYKGVAIIVFSLELGYVAWAWLDASGMETPLTALGLTPRPTVTATGTPDPRGAESLISRSKTAVASPGARFTLEMGEAEVNAVLAQQQSAAPGVRDVSVRFLSGRVEINARLVDPVPATVQASGTLVASGGRLRLLVDQASAGPIALPRAGVDLLENRANAALGDIAALRNVYVESVEVLPGKARVSARATGQ